MTAIVPSNWGSGSTLLFKGTYFQQDYKCILLQRLKKKSQEIIKSKFKFKSTVGKSICKFEPNSKKMLISGNLNQSKSEIISDRVDLINLINLTVLLLVGKSCKILGMYCLPWDLVNF